MENSEIIFLSRVLISIIRGTNFFTHIYSWLQLQSSKQREFRDYQSTVLDPTQFHYTQLTHTYFADDWYQGLILQDWSLDVVQVVSTVHAFCIYVVFRAKCKEVFIAHEEKYVHGMRAVDKGWFCQPSPFCIGSIIGSCQASFASIHLIIIMF